MDYLEKLMEDRFEAHTSLHKAHDRSHDREHIATERALELATKALEKRIDSMNELRAQLNQQAGTFARKEAVDERIAVLRGEIQTEREARKELAGSVNTWKFLASIMAMGGIATIIAAILVTSG